MSFGTGFTVSPLTASAIQNFAADVLAIAGGGGGPPVDLTPYAGLTSSNVFTANQVISGNLGVDGTITAKEYHVTYLTSSVLYQSGSTKFGDDSTDTHQFTGSVISSVGFTGSLMGDVGEFTIDRNINHNYLGSLNTLSSSSPSSDIYGNVLLGTDNQITGSDDTFGNIILAFGTRMNSQGSTYGNIILQENNIFAANAFEGNMFNAWDSTFSGSAWYSNYFGGDAHNISGAASFTANHIFGTEADINVDGGFYYNAIFGEKNKLTGSNLIKSSVIHGDNNTVTTIGSNISNNAILGTQNSSSHTSVVLLGSGLVSTNANQAIAGQYNATSSTYQFAIGNGADTDNRSNVFEVTGSSLLINGSLSASAGITGSFSGDGEYITNIATYNIPTFTNDVRSSFTAGSNIGLSAGVISLSGSLSGLTAVTSSIFTGSFVGDATGLTNIPSLSQSHIIHVASGSNSAIADGTISRPFATIQAAHAFAVSHYPSFSESVVIEIGPGNYSGNITVTRYNTYFKAATNKAESRDVSVAGTVIDGSLTVDCSTAASKYNQIVGFQGMFFTNSSDAATIRIEGNGDHLTYFKDCYVYSSNGGANAHAVYITNGNQYAGNKIVLQNTIFNSYGSSGVNANILEIEGGDVKIDSCEVYASGSSGGSGSGINMSQNCAVAINRMLLDINTNSTAINNSSDIITGVTLVISNSSFGTSDTGANISCLTVDGITLIWDCLLTADVTKEPTIKNTGVPYPLYYAAITSAVPSKIINWTSVNKVALYEEHGIVKASELSGNINASYIKGIVSVLSGGTGTGSFPMSSLLVGNGTGALSYLSGTDADNGKSLIWKSGSFILTSSAPAGINIVPTAEGQVLISSGTQFTASNITAGNNISILNGSGSITIGLSSSITASYFTGSFVGDGSQITNITASNIPSFTDDVRGQFSAGTNIGISSGIISVTGSLAATSYTSGNITGSGTLLDQIRLKDDITINSITASRGKVIGDFAVSGGVSVGDYAQFLPVGALTLPANLTASYIYTSGSTNDMYFTQYQGQYTNTVRLRWLESSLNTGLLNGGIISASNGSTGFTVSAGAGIIVTYNAFTASDPYPTIKYVNWSDLSESLQFSSSAQITYVAINNTGSIIQTTTPPSSAQYKDRIYLGRILHQSGSVINGTITTPSTAYGVNSNTSDFVRAIGPLKVSGHLLEASSSATNLSLKKSSGDSYVEGRNYTSDPNIPNYIVASSDPALDVSKIYRQRISASSPVIDTGIANAGYTELDHAQYQNSSGNLAAVGGSDYTVQRIYWFPKSVNKALFAYYGQAVYASMDDAISGISTENFVEGDNTKGAAILVGYVAMRGNAANFSNTSVARIYQAGISRGGGAGGGGGISGGSTLLANLVDVMIATPLDDQAFTYQASSGKWVNSNSVKNAINAQTASHISSLTQSVFIQGSLSASDGITGSFSGNGAGLTGITGFVTTVAATSPLSSSGGYNPIITLVTQSTNINGLDFTLGGTGSIPLIPSISASNSNLTFTSASITGLVTASLAESITVTAVTASYLSGTHLGDGSLLTGIALNYTTNYGQASMIAGTIVAMSASGITAADCSDFLKSNGFGVVQNSGSTGYVIQTLNETKVLFSSATPAASIPTGSVFYISSSGTASLYSDITGTVDGRYATQIGYFSKKVGSDYYVILQPRPFGLVY